ncbi:MAG: enolase C-terminal domain-like protein [Actinomycetota bacterium]
MVEPFRAAHGEVRERQLTVVRIETAAGIGWGECSALPDPTYTNEFAAGAYRQLVDELGPAVVGAEATGDEVVARCPQPARRPMAVAALEMAALDHRLRTEGRSLAAHLADEAASLADADATTDGSATTDGPTTTEVPTSEPGGGPAPEAAGVAASVPAGAAIGLGTPDEVVASARRLADGGFGRLKVKVEPGHDVAVVEAVRAAVPEVELHVDGNGSFGAPDLDRLVAMADAGVVAIEQPFHPADLASARALVERGGATAVVADEAATSVDAVVRLHRAGALTGVSIKPPRVGGLAPTLALHDLCRREGLAATAGGMLESGLGRHGLAAVAALPGFTLAGDLSPAGRWLTADPWPDLRLRAETGRIDVPAGPGVAPEPDLDLLSDLTVQRREITVDGGR